ncbi:MAG: hypothetical protein ACT4PE_03800, partial [Candidatus Eiseniibacteriota bacterium]
MNDARPQHARRIVPAVPALFALATAALTVLPSAVLAAAFTDIGAALTLVDGPSVGWGDYDNDGDLDLLL